MTGGSVHPRALFMPTGYLAGVEMICVAAIPEYSFRCCLLALEKHRNGQPSKTAKPSI